MDRKNRQKEQTEDMKERQKRSKMDREKGIEKQTCKIFLWKENRERRRERVSEKSGEKKLQKEHSKERRHTDIGKERGK